MEDKDVVKWNKRFNFCKWAFIVVAILSLISIIYAIVTNDVSTISYVMKCVEVIIYSLFLAFITGCTTVNKST